jgi:hypothetical protein
MLSPTDVHLLVGLLTQATSPDNVNVKLGDFVYDVASEKSRDVDITVTDPVADLEILKGIEVKKHKRPLDQSQVEQLVAKLSDMPSIKTPQIVSASGYTKAAIRKAAAHSVELLKLTDWDQDKFSFPHANFSKFESFTVRHPEFVEAPHVHLEISGGSAISNADPATFLISDEQGKPHSSGVSSFEQFKRNVLDNATDTWAKNDEFSKMPVGVAKPIDVILQFTDRPHLKAGDFIGLVTAAHVRGVLHWQEKASPAEFKMLVSESTGQLLTGCVLAELPNGNLVGITASSADRTIKFINVAVSLRNLNVIHEMKLDRGK